jgi:hypothetical protein
MMTVKEDKLLLVRKQFIEIPWEKDLPQGPETLKQRYRDGFYKDANWEDFCEVDVQHAHTLSLYFLTSHEIVEYVRRVARLMPDHHAINELRGMLSAAVLEEETEMLGRESAAFRKTRTKLTE